MSRTQPIILRRQREQELVHLEAKARNSWQKYSSKAHRLRRIVEPTAEQKLLPQQLDINLPRAGSNSILFSTSDFRIIDRLIGQGANRSQRPVLPHPLFGLQAANTFDC
jgi:hypothetical protein